MAENNYVKKKGKISRLSSLSVFFFINFQTKTSVVFSTFFIQQNYKHDADHTIH